MAGWDRNLDLSLGSWAIAGVLGGVALVSWAVYLGTVARRQPTRCPLGFVESEARCCAPGQATSKGACVGKPDFCPAPSAPAPGADPGCVTPGRRVHVPGGTVTIGPTDWDTVNVVSRRTIAVRPFYVDSVEVTVARYRPCEASGGCRALGDGLEPGVPVRSVSVGDAEKFCSFAGGRLPTPEEWVFVAAGTEARRYPWGAHGLVCRRAAFGLSEGPCGEGGTSPELTGLRPDGATPEGVFDLSGNVAEWAVTPDGRSSVHGGSFRSNTAGELKTWSTRAPELADDIGFRCVYPSEPGDGPSNGRARPAVERSPASAPGGPPVR